MRTEVGMSAMEDEYCHVYCDEGTDSLIPYGKFWRTFLRIERDLQSERDLLSAISTVWEDNQARLTLANTPPSTRCKDCLILKSQSH